MGIFSKVFGKSEDSESIAFDAYKVETESQIKPVNTDEEDDPTAGCNRCKNKQGGFCKGKVFRCEAFRPVDGEQTDNDESKN